VPMGSPGATTGPIYSFPQPEALEMTNSAGNAIAIPSAAVTTNTPGFNEQAGAFSSSFTVTWEPANGVALPVPSQLSPATAGSSAGATAAADALFAQDGVLSRLGTGLPL
jgi:hypothetical protein